MSRVARYKLGYVAVFVVVLLLCLLILYLGNWNVRIALAVALVVFLPGRIQGLLFRDLFRGRVELDRNNPSAALSHFERFLLLVQSQPWRKPALWLSWSTYTPNVEAMTLNNIGSAHLALGNEGAAIDAWRRALELDRLYPIPLVNLSVVEEARGSTARAAECLSEARRLGYSGAPLDRAIHAAQRLLPRIESKGPAL